MGERSKRQRKKEDEQNLNHGKEKGKMVRRWGRRREVGEEVFGEKMM